MKKYIIVLILLFCINVNCQSRGGSATYSLVIPEDSIYQSQPALKLIYSEAMENSKLLNFSLHFTENESIFSLNDILVEGSYGFALALADYYNPIYTNLETDEKIHLSGDNEYQITDTILSNWKLTSETKTIGNYLCYKATSNYIIKKSASTHVSPIIVWYCPSIPFSFGPVGFGGLPGLILECQRENFSYGLTNLNLDKAHSIKRPVKGRKITNRDYNIKLEEASKRAREDFERSKN